MKVSEKSKRNICSTGYYVLGGCLIALGLISFIFFIILSHRSVANGMEHTETVIGPSKTDIDFKYSGRYEIKYLSYVLWNDSFDERAISDLYINVIRKSDNSILIVKPSNTGNIIHEKTWYYISSPGIYTLEIGYLHQQGPTIEVTVRSNNSTLFNEIGFIISVVFLLAGIITIVVTAIKQYKISNGIIALNE